MIIELFARQVGQILSDIFGEVLKKPIDKFLDEQALKRSLSSVIKRAEKRFYHDYRSRDAQLVDALIEQSHFASLPSIRAALHEMLAHPFYDPTQPLSVVHQSFSDVLPKQMDRTRVDAAVSTFLLYLGQEVLLIPELQQLYQLVYQKLQAEYNQKIAVNTDVLVETMRGLQEDIKLFPLKPAESVQAVSFPQLERPRPWHNLPQPNYSEFLGRQTELDKLIHLMQPYPRSRHFLVTLDGFGGVGKSALAFELAYYYRDNYASLPPEERFDAIVWVSAKRTFLTANGILHRSQTFSNLADLYREIALVLQRPAILQADLHDQWNLVEQALRDTRTLLIVDNLETVDDDELPTFLRELPDPTKAIVTTRHRIDIAYAIRLGGLPYEHALELINFEAERKEVSLTPNMANDLLKWTGGNPLAIVWSIALISLGYEADAAFRRLRSGFSDIARFCFNESIARVQDHDAYRILLAMSLFDLSASRQMVGEIAGLGSDEIGLDDGLAELLQLSLVNQEGDRFSLLPLTRSYALSKLTQQPTLEDQLREQWVKCLTSLARPFFDLYWRWPDTLLLLQEGMHIVTLASWCEQTTRLDVLIQILPALSAYYEMTDQWADMLHIGDIGLEYARLIGDLKSIVLTETHIFAWILSQQGRQQAAEEAITNALNAAKQLDDPAWQCETLINFSQVLCRREAFEEARACCHEAFQLIKNWNDPRQMYIHADIENELGRIAFDEENWELARAHFLEAQHIFRYDDNNPAFNIERAWDVYRNLGFVAHKLGNIDEAAQIYQQCLIYYSSIGSRPKLTALLVHLAELQEQTGNSSDALRYAREALKWSHRLGLIKEQTQAEAICTRLKAES